MTKTEQRSPVAILVPEDAGVVQNHAADELAQGLALMLGWAPRREVAPIDASTLAIGTRPEANAPRAPADGYAIEVAGQTLWLVGAGPRQLLDAVCALLRRLGASCPLGGAPRFPSIATSAADECLPPALREVGAVRWAPPFNRRALVSDIMTWHYAQADRLQAHLADDREFIPWMARCGINAFFYIRHAVDSRYRIEELEPLMERWGVQIEYGGHILQQLLPRELFAHCPQLFPQAADATRNPRGNLCVSQPRALELIGTNAREYLRPHPDIRRLHIWGADVFAGAWCECAQCRELAPQIQYMRAVTAIAQAAAPVEVAYLGYHDTLEPVPGLNPPDNVWLEWAPRERCYRHAIDDRDCQRNARYFEALRRYLDIFAGRCHVFEYYADAILFGGLSVAMPRTIARDLRAYRALGIRSISCLTFGAFSVFAYPANLIAFAELSADLEAPSTQLLARAAGERHGLCAPRAAQAYAEVENATRLTLDYGDVMRPYVPAQQRETKRRELEAAAMALRRARALAISSNGDPLMVAEAQLWDYGATTLQGLAEFLCALHTADRARGEAAIARLSAALGLVRAIHADIKGTWGAFDLERFHQIWLNRMQRELVQTK